MRAECCVAAVLEVMGFYAERAADSRRRLWGSGDGMRRTGPLPTMAEFQPLVEGLPYTS